LALVGYQVWIDDTNEDSLSEYQQQEAYFICAERCDGYAPVVPPYVTAQGMSYCYCDTTQPDPDQLRANTAQEQLDEITSEPPPNFHI